MAPVVFRSRNISSQRELTRLSVPFSAAPNTISGSFCGEEDVDWRNK